jgi:(p)ppGpp synthase/HD superfamily hydrolase
MTDSSANFLISLSMQIAIKAHFGQYRRDGVTPYIKHPIAVADRVSHLGYEYACVAYLHDVIEDTKVTDSDLKDEGIPENILKAVAILSKNLYNENVSYDQYLSCVKKNELARKVKIADMISNLADNPTDKQIKKYAKGLLFLVD